MANELAPRKGPAESYLVGVRRLEFGQDTAFHVELRRRVDEHFRNTGRPRRGGGRMYLKTAVILAWFAGSYGFLVFAASTVWQGLILAASLGLATAGIGINIQHDAGHQAYSDRRRVNRLMAMTLDAIGGSSYVWYWKHTIIHHRYVNITGYDNDINLHQLGRFSPHLPWRWYYRWQRFYLWLLYGFEAAKLQLLDDFRYILTSRLGLHQIPRPRRRELALFIAGKVVFFSWALAIPMLFHPVGVVLFYYLVASLVLGLSMVLVFILPHASGSVEFPLPDPATGRIETPWAVHQATVTLNFAQRNRVVTWLLGGLNYHKEHHLLPLVCHVNYPALSQVVEQTCRDFGIPYKEHASLAVGLAAHYRWLRRMGRPEGER